VQNGTNIILVRPEGSGWKYSSSLHNTRVKENIKQIADNDRRLMWEKSIARTDSFESMKVFIVIDIFCLIEEVLVLLEDSSYRIFVKEISPTTKVFHRDQMKSNYCSKEAMDRHDSVPVFEDLEVGRQWILKSICWVLWPKISGIGTGSPCCTDTGVPRRRAEDGEDRKVARGCRATANFLPPCFGG